MIPEEQPVPTSQDSSEGSAEIAQRPDPRTAGQASSTRLTSSDWMRRVVLPLVVLAAGVAAAVVVVRAKPEATRAAPERSARLVETAPLVPEPVQAKIQSRGLVQAEREITLIPEVSGKVIFVSDSLVAGGKVKKGDVLLRIDGRSYAYQVTQQTGQLRTAEHQVEVEKSQREIAAYESQVLADVGSRSPVATRESHLKAAQSALEAQMGAVESAKLNLARTVIRAPFDATVVTDNVDVGQVVGLSSQLARLVATDVLRIEVSVALEDLQMLLMPSEEQPGSEAVIRQELSRGRIVERTGRVTRLVRELDDMTRRARVLVEVADPFNPELGLPLLPGARVEVELLGRQLEPLTKIPRSAVSDGRTIWVIGPDSKLASRKIDIAWEDRDYVYAADDFPATERLVTTPLATPLEGLLVRTQDAASDSTRAKAETPLTTSPSAVVPAAHPPTEASKSAPAQGAM